MEWFFDRCHDLEINDKVKRLNNSTTQRLNNSTTQRLIDSTTQRLNKYIRDSCLRESGVWVLGMSYQHFIGLYDLTTPQLKHTILGAGVSQNEKNKFKNKFKIKSKSQSQSNSKKA